MQSEYIIEDNVPIPRKSDQYPVEDLKPGQSFVVPFEQKNPRNNQIQALRATIYEATDRAKAYWRRKKEFAVYTTRVTDEGIRIWRTM